MPAAQTSTQTGKADWPRCPTWNSVLPKHHNVRLLLLGLLLATASAGNAAVCHIHPPADEAAAQPELIGPIASAAACEAERRQRFGALGRCHCTAPFTPDGLIPGLGPERGDLPQRGGAAPLGPNSEPLLP
jgi:hypothetical protein